MSEHSVFHKLVSKEPSYSQLLCNLLRLDDGFRSTMLTQLLTGTLAAAIPSVAIRSERVLRECGRPDLVIRSAQLCAIVEVKTNPKRGPTPYQELPTDEDDVDIKSYFSFLQRQKERERWFVMLVPETWTHRAEFEDKLDALTKRYRQIKARIVTWQDILDVIERNKRAGTACNPFVEEFHKLLVRQFGQLTFSEEECHMVQSIESPGAFRSIRKLQMLIDAIEKFETKKNKRYKISPDQGEDYYGFTYVVKGRDKQALFWFGLWQGPWEQFGAPLCVAVCPEHEYYDGAVIKAFCRAYKNDAAREVEQYDYKFIVHPIAGDMLKSKDPVGALQKQLQSLAEKLEGSLKDRTTVNTSRKQASKRR